MPFFSTTPCMTLGKVSRPEAESAGCKKTRVFFESVQHAQTLLAELDTRKAISHNKDVQDGI